MTVAQLIAELRGAEMNYLLELAKATSGLEIKYGLKGHPGCKECQCYPEGRNDCPDHMKCREWLERLKKVDLTT